MNPHAHRSLSLLGCLLALVVSLPAAASEAKGVLLVTAQVVHTAQIQVETAPQKVEAPRAVHGGSEWTVPVKASAKSLDSAGIRFQVKDCAGAQAEWVEAKDGAADHDLRVFVPNGATCAPVVVATVYPDGTPPDAQGL